MRSGSRVTALLTRPLALLGLGLWLGWQGACAGAQSTAPSTRMAIHRWEDPARDSWSQPDKVVETLKLREPIYIVDLGAGSGYFSRRLARANPEGQVLALEVSRAFRSHIEAHREAWGTPNLETRLVINNNPLLREASVDLVFMSNTYRFLDDRSAYFRDLRDALRPGGRIAIVDFRQDAQCGDLPECPPPRERVPASLVKTEMQGAGFTLAKHHDFLKHQYFLEFVVPPVSQTQDAPETP